MKIRVMAVSIIMLAALFSAKVMAAGVLQGECISYNNAKKVVTIREYDTRFDAKFKYGHPTKVESEIDLSHAHIGIQPEPKDILRIAYTMDGPLKVGLKVMNVSKQDLTKK